MESSTDTLVDENPEERGGEAGEVDDSCPEKGSGGEGQCQE